MFLKSGIKIGFVALAIFGSVATVAYATHSWGNYHWARESNPLTLAVVDSVTSQWDSYLDTANADWSVSTVLDFTKESGSIDGKDRRRCNPVAGKIRACNSTYGNNGWLGLAQIWVSGSHIAQGVAKLNDTYFNKSYYNTAPWRRLVMCQELAHDFGLGHQDENSYNANLGSCMDYTNDPDGGLGGAVSDDPSNEHPNLHDYDQIEAIYNAHLDLASTSQTFRHQGNHGDVAEWGKSIRQDGKGKTSLYERDLGKGDKVITFVIWAE